MNGVYCIINFPMTVRNIELTMLMVLQLLDFTTLRNVVRIVIINLSHYL